MPRHLVASCALGLLVLSGCGGEPEKPEPTKATSSPTSTTPAVPELPEAARMKSLKGAKAFARHYVGLVNLAQASGQIAPLERAGLDSCATCTRVASHLREIHSAGGEIKGGAWTVEKMVAVRGSAPKGVDPGVIVRVDIHSTRQVVIRPDKPNDVLPAGPAAHLLSMSWVRGSWKVAAWDPA